MKYFKRNWAETRGDELDHWGTSIWYMETSEEGNVTRQIEVYANGPVLKYDEASPADEYGGLADQPLDMEDFVDFIIDKGEFEMAWSIASS